MSTAPAHSCAKFGCFCGFLFSAPRSVRPLLCIRVYNWARNISPRLHVQLGTRPYLLHRSIYRLAHSNNHPVVVLVISNDRTCANFLLFISEVPLRNICSPSCSPILTNVPKLSATGMGFTTSAFGSTATRRCGKCSRTCSTTCRSQLWWMTRCDTSRTMLPHVKYVAR